MSYLKNKLNKIKKFFNKELIIYSNIISEDTIIATIPFKKIGEFTFNDISDCLIKKGMKDFNYYTEINKVKEIIPSTSDIHLSNITSGYIIVLNMYLSLVERIGYFKYIKNKNTNNRNFKEYINNLSEKIQHKDINTKLKSLITKLQKANQEGNYKKFEKELIENYEKNKKIIESNKTNSQTASSNMSISNSNNKTNSQTISSNMSMTRSNNKINSQNVNSNMSMSNSNSNNMNTSKNIKPSITISPHNPNPINIKTKSKTNFKKGDTVYWYSNLQNKYKYGILGNKTMSKNGKIKYYINKPKYYNNNTSIAGQQTPISENKLINKNNIKIKKE